MPDYHHTVIRKATPFGEFTKWCHPPQNKAVTKQDLFRLRRLKLRQWIAANFEGNVSRFASKTGISQSQIADTLGGAKSFGEKVAIKIETKAQMPPGFLMSPTDSDGGPGGSNLSYHGIQLTMAGAMLAAEWEKLDINDRIDIEHEILGRVASNVRRKRKQARFPDESDKKSKAS